MNAPQTGKPDDSKIVAGWLIAGTVFAAAAFYGWASGGWQRGYQRQYHPRQLSPAEADQVYRSQFSSEQERLEFEDWNRAQEELQRDAPVGQTHGGDTY